MLFKTRTYVVTMFLTILLMVVAFFVSFANYQHGNKPASIFPLTPVSGQGIPMSTPAVEFDTKGNCISHCTGIDYE